MYEPSEPSEAVQAAADARGRDWDAGPALTPEQQERARIAAQSREVNTAIAREDDGWEWDAAAGQSRRASWGPVS